MSVASSKNIVRLQELKLWQDGYENSIKTHRKSVPKKQEITPSSSTTSQCIPSNSWDQIEIVSCKKPFDELLEEKLAEEHPVKVTNKPKYSYLKKGQGLIRFKMKTTPNNSISNSNRKSVISAKKGILKKTFTEFNPDVDSTPLAVPDFIKSKGTWKHVLENASNCISVSHSYEQDDKYEQFKKRLSLNNNKNDTIDDGINVLEMTNESLNSQTQNDQKINNLHNEIMDEIKSYAAMNFRSGNDNNMPYEIEATENNSTTSTNAKKSLYYGDIYEEEKSELELMAFEMLEKRVENASFNSNNNSIINLLKASTPRKFIETRQSDSMDSIHDKNEKLIDLMQKSEVLKQFLINLHKLDGSYQQQTTCTETTIDSSCIQRNGSMISSISDEGTRWSTRSPSLIDDESNIQSNETNGSEKIDIGINTSWSCPNDFDDTIKDTFNCKNCEELRLKLSNKTEDFNQLKSNHTKLKSELKDLEEKYNKIRKDKKTNEQQYKNRIEELENELASEQKKLIKEKVYFETYVKNTENRPNKKEREEINQLKQELVNCKELIKLKDTKYGATQARLRTQIKQYEKDSAELKITVEKLQRENAKLNSNQKYMRRPNEMKMLQDINKQLTKLTDESLRNLRQNGGGSASGDPPDNDINDYETTNNCKMSNTFNKNKGKKPLEKHKNLKKQNSETKISTNNNSNSEISSNKMDVDNVEKRYENMFGNFSSPRNNSNHLSVSVSDKNERTLPDGTIEITYSNGNFKTVSPDGQIIKMKYFNGDTKETNLIENVIRYHYAATDAWHTQYPDGSEVLQYADGQKCTKQKDGRTEISYPDGSFQTINIDGSQEHHFPDGRKTLKQPNGEQTIYLPNGQKEIHTDTYKRREYPDGTMRTLYEDGSVETVYANGRIRLKDANGKLILDTHQEY